MSPTPLARIRALFDALVELPETQRAAYLAAQTDLDAPTRQHLDDLLRADADYAATTVRTPLPATREAGAAPCWLGRRIGAFQIVRELGRGGMGSVFLAERVDGGVEQQVAIKIVRPEQLDATLLARFRLEWQLLALLQHPNIPSMLDLGELADGSPYAVMEYVDGVPIDRYVRERQLDLRQCLRLFVQVCNTVAYAHRNLIVHRDIKPGNVLVNAEGHPQLLDFGIAKPLLGQVGSIDVTQTGAADNFLSLSHAAPEQLSGAPITTACDVYSLGMLLYELLAGGGPFARDAQTPAQLVQQILHEEPVAPSRRAAEIGVAPGYRIAADLDLIVLRCLRKTAEDRYVSLDWLAEDLERFLAGRPVHARRGNWWYRTTRFVARHRVATALAIALATTGAAAAGLLWSQQHAVTRQQSRADALTSLILDTLANSEPDRNGGRELSAHDVFSGVAAQVRGSSTLDAQSRTQLLTAIARIDLALGLPQESEALLAALDADNLNGTQRSNVELLRAQTLIALQRHAEAHTLIQSGLAAQDTAQWQLLDATLAWEQGDAETALRKLQTLAAAMPPAADGAARAPLQPGVLWLDRRQRDAVDTLLHRLAELPRPDAAQPMVAGAEGRRGSGLMTPLLEPLAATAFGWNSLSNTRVLAARRDHYTTSGSFTWAAKVEQQQLAMLQQHFGPAHARVAESHRTIARLRARESSFAIAGEHYRKAVEIGAQVWPAQDRQLRRLRAEAAAFLAHTDQCAAGLSLSAETTRSAPVAVTDDAELLLSAAVHVCRHRETPGFVTAAAAAQALRAAGRITDGELRRMWEPLLASARARGIDAVP